MTMKNSRNEELSDKLQSILEKRLRAIYKVTKTVNADKELLDNPVWADVWKFYTVMTSQPASPKDDWHTGEYICEKLLAILERRTYWHSRINEAFEDFKGNPHQAKSLYNKIKRSPKMMKMNEAMEMVRRNGFEIMPLKEYEAMNKVIRNLNEIKVYLEEH